jgi:hypothetical protein
MHIDQMNFGAVKALAELIEPLGLTLEDAGGSVDIFGRDPLFSSCVRLGEARSGFRADPGETRPRPEPPSARR